MAAPENWQRQQNLETGRIVYQWENTPTGHRLMVMDQEDGTYAIAGQQAGESGADKRVDKDFSNKETARTVAVEIMGDEPYMLTEDEEERIQDDILEHTGDQYTNTSVVTSLSGEELVEEWYGSVGQWLVTRTDMHRKAMMQSQYEDGIDDLIDAELRRVIRDEPTEH